MKKLALSSILLLLILSVQAQEETKKLCVGLYADVVRTEFLKRGERGTLEGFQTALEANYQLAKPVALTAGLEYWGPETGFGLVGGARYYPHKNFFLRARGILLINRSAIGGGWKKPIGKFWDLELIGDYYFKETIAARVGLTYTLQ